MLAGGARQALAATLACLVVAAPASAEVVGKEGGLTYVKKVKTLQGGSAPQIAEAVAECPDGMVHTGGGASVTGDPEGTTLSTVGIGDDNSWYASGWHTGINPKDKKLTTWVICTSKVAQMSDDTETVPVGPGPVGGTAATPCEAGFVTGGGARLIGAADDWRLNSSYPIDLTDPDSFADDGWRAFAYHLDGTSASTMLVDVVCLTGKEPNYGVVADTTFEPVVTIKSGCAQDRAVTGGGALSSEATNAAYMLATAPYDSKQDKDKVPDDGWKVKYKNNAGGLQTFTATAICR